MLMVVSPAKSLNFAGPDPDVAVTEAAFPEKTARLVSALERMPAAKLKQIMPVSDSLIALNRSRYRKFYDQPERAAVFAYNGDVYTGFEARTLDEAALRFAQDHLRILSGLYGLLRPFDAIRPHRLEMGTRWAPRYKKLTDFWGDHIANALSRDLATIESPILLNLASQEYWASVQPHIRRFKARIIGFDFRRDTGGGLQFVSFDAKRARGMMARYVCENYLSDPESLKAFDYDGYRFDPETSSENLLSFVR